MSNDLTPEQMKRIAASMSAMGRYGDSQLVHVNPQEVALLEKIGSGTTNPHTGLREFFFGYDSLSDMFDGGGPGQSGNTFDNDNDPNNEVTGIAAISNNIVGAGHANNGLNDDDSRGDNTDYTYDSITDMFDGGGIGMSGDTYGHGDFSALDKNNDGHISRAESGDGLKGGIDGDNDSMFKTVANVAGMVLNPVGYAATKLAATALESNDFDFDFLKNKGGSTTKSTVQVASSSNDDRPPSTTASTQSTSTGEVDETGASNEEGTYSEISDNVSYRGPAFTSKPERRKFIEYDYTDGTGKPVRTYNGNAKPFHVATSAESIESYVVAETTANAIDAMVSNMSREMQDKLSGEISVQLTADNQIALYVGNDTTGYVEAVYAPTDEGMDTAMKDVANMLAYGESTGDLTIDAGYTGRVRSAQRYEGYDDATLNQQYAMLKSEGSNYEQGSPLYLLWLERLQELEDEIKRRDGDPAANTAEYSVAGITRSIADAASGFFA